MLNCRRSSTRLEQTPAAPRPRSAFNMAEYYRHRLLRSFAHTLLCSSHSTFALTEDWSFRGTETCLVALHPGPKRISVMRTQCSPKPDSTSIAKLADLNHVGVHGKYILSARISFDPCGSPLVPSQSTLGFALCVSLKAPSSTLVPTLFAIFNSEQDNLTVTTAEEIASHTFGSKSERILMSW